MTPAVVGQEELELRTSIQRNLERNVGEVVFKTNLASSSKTKTVVSAVTDVCTNTNIPVEIAREVVNPLINTRQVVVAVVCAAQTEVEFETVGAKTLLEGKFSTITSAAAETETKCILCVSSETKCYDCNQS